MDKLFEDLRAKRLKQDKDNIELFIIQFESQSDEYFDQKEDQLRQLVESINDEMVRLVDQYRQIQSSKIQTNNHQQTIITINSIKQNYEQIINQSKQIINQQKSRYDQMMIKYDGRLKQIQQLQKNIKRKLFWKPLKIKIFQQKI